MWKDGQTLRVTPRGKWGNRPVVWYLDGVVYMTQDWYDWFFKGGQGLEWDSSFGISHSRNKSLLKQSGIPGTDYAAWWQRWFVDLVTSTPYTYDEMHKESRDFEGEPGSDMET